MRWQLTLPVSDDLGCLWKFLTIVWSVGAHYLWEKLNFQDYQDESVLRPVQGGSPHGTVFPQYSRTTPSSFLLLRYNFCISLLFSNKSKSLENFWSRKMLRFMNNVMPWETHFVVNIWKKTTSVRWTVGKEGSCHLCTTWQLNSWAMHRHLASC